MTSGAITLGCVTLALNEIGFSRDHDWSVCNSLLLPNACNFHFVPMAQLLFEFSACRTKLENRRGVNTGVNKTGFPQKVPGARGFFVG
jgi:hypothetical protein